MHRITTIDSPRGRAWARYYPALLCALGLHCGSAEPAALPELPAVVAASKYIDYSTTGDTSTLCLDDSLARGDRFIEEVAAYLEVDPPTGRIRHHQVTGAELGEPDTYPCEGTFHCYSYYEAEDVGLIRSVSRSHDHELVHAVEIPALGLGHRTLAEGLATYLGSANTSDEVLPDFPARFKAMLARSPMPDDYRVAMHFVGSLLLRDGVDAYKRLHGAMPIDSGPGEFAEVYAEVLGVSLDAALAEMSAAPVRGRRIPAGCEGNESPEIEHIPWNSEGFAQATLGLRCGDPFFAAGPTDAGKIFTIDVPSAATYKQIVTGLRVAQLQVDLQTCPDGFGYTGHGNRPGPWYVDVSRPGRHRLTVGYTQATQVPTEAQFRLELDGPTP